MAESSSKKVEYESIRDPDLKIAYVDGAYCLLNPNFGQLLLYIDDPIQKIAGEEELVVEKVQRHFTLDLRMSPETFRRIAYWMMEHVDTYENWLIELARSLDEEKKKE